MAIIKSLPSKGSVNYIGNVFELVHNILNFYFFLGRNFIKNLYLFIFINLPYNPLRFRQCYNNFLIVFNIVIGKSTILAIF